MIPSLLIADHETSSMVMLTAPKLTIGRESTNDIVIDNPAISRMHAMLSTTAEGRVMLVDLGSANGTFHNGRKISTPVTLTDGDVISVGEVRITFNNPQELGDDDASVMNEATVNLISDAVSTVFVADIRGFTKLSEALDPKTLSELINAWFSRAHAVVTRHGGHVEKFIGDCVMASWMHATDADSVPNARCALTTAVDLYRATEELERAYAHVLPFPLRIGVGINTGPVVRGNLGTELKREFTILGDTVNMAFRFESYTKKLGFDVNVGASTYRHLTAHDAFIRTTIDLPGRATSEEIHGISMDALEKYLKMIT